MTEPDQLVSLDPVLLVEDSPDDVFFFQRAAVEAHLANPVEVAADGDVAIRWLERAGHGEARMPLLVMLDLKMPRVPGFEVLRHIRAHANATLRHVPVVVFTSSRLDPDVERAYQLGANSYIVKPVSIAALTDLVRTLGLYWAVINVRHQKP